MRSLRRSASVLLSGLVMALCLTGSAAAERGLLAFASHLACACPHEGQAGGDQAPAAEAGCCERENVAGVALVPEAEAGTASCCCSAVPEGARVPPGTTPGSAQGGELALRALEDGAGISARTPHAPGPSFAPDVDPAPTDAGPAGAPPRGTGPTGLQRLLVAGAAGFVCVLCCLRS